MIVPTAFSCLHLGVTVNQNVLPHIFIKIFKVGGIDLNMPSTLAFWPYQACVK